MAAVDERYDIWRPAPDTLEDVRDPDDRSFPTGVLRDCKTALVLFSSAWYGKQDAYYVAAAGLRATCVDIRNDNFEDMERLYPDDWEFIQDDAYEFVRQTHRRWDVVTVDCPSGHFQKCADLLPLLCRLARVTVILGSGVDTRLVPPEGWRVVTRNRRSMMYGGVYWTVLRS